MQHNYLRLLQKQRAFVIRPLVTGMAQFNVWPYQFVRLDRSESEPPDTSLDEILTGQQRLKILPIRQRRGALDQIILYNVPNFRDVRDFLVAWTAAAGSPPLLFHPAQRNLTMTTRQLTGEAPEGGFTKGGWTPLIDPDVIEAVRERLGLNRDLRKEGVPAR